jgi:hypothetical protein
LVNGKWPDNEIESWDQPLTDEEFVDGEASVEAEADTEPGGEIC